MMLEFLIPFIASYLAIWIGFYIFQRFNFKNKYENSFSLRNTFTFETHNFKSENNKILRVWFPVATILGIIPFVVFFSIEGIHYTIHVHALIAGALLLVSFVFKILIFFTKTINIKLFITEYVARMLTFFGSILFFVIGIMTTISENFALYQDNQLVMWLFFGVFLILLVANASGFFNKKFFNWYYFEKDENEQIKKPNTICLALYQWIFDFSEVIFVILASIFMYFL